MQTADLKAHVESQGYWHEKHGDRLTVNSSAPWDEPSDDDRRPGSGVLGVLYVESGVLHFEWQWDAGYDEHWTFATIGEFADFYDRFLTDGINGVS